MKRGGIRRKRLFGRTILFTSVVFFIGFGLLLLTLRSVDDPNSSFIDDDDDDAVSDEDNARWINSSSVVEAKVDGGRLCATVEEMGSEFDGGFVDQSLRVRDVIRRHFHLNGAAAVRELAPEEFCRRGYVLGKTAEAGFGNEMYKILTSGALSIMLNRSLIIGQTRGKYPFGDYIAYSNDTFTLTEVKHLWRQKGCVKKYGRRLVMRLDDFEKPAKSNVLCSNWKKWEEAIIWFQGTTDAVASQFFLKNVHNYSKSDAKGELGFELRGRGRGRRRRIAIKLPSLMAMTTTISSFSLSLPQVTIRNKPTNPSPFLFLLPRFNSRFRPLTLTPSASTSSNNFSGDDGFSLDDFTLHSDSRSPKKCLIADLIQEIEPLDVSLIQKDVPLTTLDAMKRTISGMLGLLPSDRFQVHIESLWEPLSKLLVSSMMTGYTLRNAEYRLFLEKNLDMDDEDLESHTAENTEYDVKGTDAEPDDVCAENNGSSTKDSNTQSLSEMIDKEGLGRVSSEAQEYIFRLQSQLSSVKKELQEVRRKNAALQMQQFVGEEKNDLLDYLRSLQPEKVAELSEPAAPEVKETIHSVVHGLLATLSPKMHSKLPTSEEAPPTEIVNAKGDEDCAELVENTSLHFQPLISLTRDYLARLLFWCMLLGHYLRGLEYRMELMEVLNLTCDANGSENVA